MTTPRRSPLPPRTARLTPLTRSPEAPMADPLSAYTGILTAAHRLSVSYQRANPAWDHVITSYVRSIV